MFNTQIDNVFDDNCVVEVCSEAGHSRILLSYFATNKVSKNSKTYLNLVRAKNVET